MPKKLFITTPIYYVNGEPHLGHAYTTIAADVIARFHRMDGFDVMFLTGTDEHGQKVEKAACAAGVSPQQYVDDISENFRALKDILNLSFDQFIRTTEARHKHAAQYLWQKLKENGFIYQSTYAGWYSVRDEAYYQESELVDGKAPTGAEVEWVEESSYFFKLSAFQEPLLAYYRDHPEAIGPKSRLNEVVRFIEGGLRDLSISRSTLKWGVPVPDDPDHVMYVWIDALTNYITALGYPDQDISPYWNQSLHLMGKDILRFHAVYWPAFLMGAGLQPPRRVFAHGWWVSDGEKMSKSIGNVIDPIDLVKRYGSDVLRYFLIREVPFGNDGDFSMESFVGRVNADLANDYGNLCQRVLSFVQKNAHAVVPTANSFTEQDQHVLQEASRILEEVRQDMADQALHKYSASVWKIIGDANRYIDAQQPWALRKTDTERMSTVLYVLLDLIRKASLLARPLIPLAADRALDYLAVPEEQRNFAFYEEGLMPGTSLPEPVALFPRIEA